MKWKDKIRDPDCTLCPLHEEAEHVCLMGAGSRKSKIMIVGEAPGAREDETHQAFVGPAGALLTELLSEAGISRDECYITNIAKCRPPSNRSPEWSEIKTCRDAYFWQEVDKVQPSHILLLGGSAMRGVTGRSGITKHRGTVYEVRGAQALSTFHPAYVLRSPYFRSTLAADVKRFARMVKGESAAAETTKVKIVRNKQQLKWLIHQLMECKVNSYDIETYTDGTENNFREWHPDSKIVSISFSWKVGEAVVVPLHHESTPWKNPDAVLRRLKPCLERPDVKYIAHNGNYDCRWLASRGIFVRQSFDTMLAAHMLEENRSKGLKQLAQTILGVDAWDVGVEVSNAYYENLRKLCIYNGNDTDYTLRLYEHFKKELKDEPRIARVFALLMMPATGPITQMETGGVWIDPKRYRKRLKATVVKRDGVESELRESCGDINLRSPDQVARWLFEDLELPIIERSKKTKKPSTKESVILRLARQSPELRKLIEYRKLEQKYIRTYFKQWEVRDENSRFHPGYKLFGTVTGRISGDFQQVPRDPFMRSIIGAPSGWVLLEADYAQIELRLAAWIANERRLLREFALGEDPHRNMAVDITHKRPQDITSEERKHGKSANFGFLFSMGGKKFVEYAFEKYEIVLTEAEGQMYYDRFHERYPAFRPWHDRQRRLVHRYQRVHSPIGRVRHLPTVLSSDRGMVLEAERQAINSPVQSLASDIMLLSMVRLGGILPSTRAFPVFTVHDSIGYQIREDFVEEAIPIIRETMEDVTPLKKKFGCDITVPVKVELKVGQHWGEGKVV